MSSNNIVLNTIINQLSLAFNNSSKATTPREDNSAKVDRKVGDPLKVSFAQKTFDAEGVEAPGRFFSRAISWPKLGNSGVTIGRGYDMGQRSARQIVRELTSAGMQLPDAEFLSQAAGKRGDAAREFVDSFRPTSPIMSLEVQRNLFENVTTPEMVNDIKRIFNKPDVVGSYGRASWDSLPAAAQELVFDLRYRGDYTPATRKLIQTHLVNGDYQALREVISDTEYWRSRGVPSARIRERQEIASKL